MSATAQPRRLHPIIPLISLIKQLPELLVPIGGVIAVARDEGFATLLLAVGALLAVVFAYRILAWWRFTYKLLDNEIYIESGVFTRNRRSIPWDRVQDVEIERGPLARILGLAKVKLETGGAGNDEGLLDSITLADALALRDEVRTRRGILAIHTPRLTSPELPVFKMSDLRILQAGFFNFSLLWLAVIAAAAQYFNNLLPWSQDDVEKWIGLHQEEIWGMVGPVTIILALGLFAVLGSLAGMIEMFVRNYGFTLSLENRSLRRVRGLLTRSEVAIPLKRIQAARTSTHWLKSWFGFCKVDAQTMAGASSGGLQDLAPLATEDEAEHVLAIAGDYKRIPSTNFTPVAPIHRWYDARTSALPLALIILAAGVLSPPLWWGLVFVICLATAQVIAARPHGWRVDGNTLYVREGWFNQEHWLVPIANIHSVSLLTGPLQRRLGIATIAIDSAGAPGNGLRIRNLSLIDARALVERLRVRRGHRHISTEISPIGPVVQPQWSSELMADNYKPDDGT